MRYLEFLSIFSLKIQLGDFHFDSSLLTVDHQTLCVQKISDTQINPLLALCSNNSKVFT